jgi:hypothetical protein
MRLICDAIQRAGLDMRFALDVASVARGIRKLGLLHVVVEQEQATRACLDQFGLVVVASRALHRIADPHSREHILVDSGSTPGDACVEIWFSASSGSAPSASELFGDPGRHLGYPACCTRFMLESPSLARHYRRYLFDTTARHWEINRLTTLFSPGLLMPDFFPCSLACLAAREFATPFIQLAKETLPEGAANNWIQQAQQPLLLHRDSVISFSRWRIDGNTLHLSAASARSIGVKEVIPRGDFPPFTRPVLLHFRHLRSAPEADAPTIARIETARGETVSIDLPTDISES